MKTLLIILMSAVIPHLLSAQETEGMTFREIKQEIEEETGDDYQVKGEYNSELDMYMLSKPEITTLEEKEITYLVTYLFESKMPNEPLANILNTTSIENLNYFIKYFNKHYVKREGKFTWDDYRDNSSVSIVILREGDVFIWSWNTD